MTAIFQLKWQPPDSNMYVLTLWTLKTTQKECLTHQGYTEQGKTFPVSWNTALTDFMISNLPPESHSQCRPALPIDIPALGEQPMAPSLPPFPVTPLHVLAKCLSGQGKFWSRKKYKEATQGEKEGHKMTHSTWGYLLLLFLLLPACSSLLSPFSSL